MAANESNYSKVPEYAQSKRLTIARTVLLLIAVIAFTSEAGCSRKEEPKRSEKITIAVTPWPASTPIFIARENGYFREEGLDAEFQSHESGHLGLASALSGEADLAEAADTPIARAAVHAKPLAVIATIAEIDRLILIIARRDRGIEAPRDLKGKRIGLTSGTGAEYFLHTYLAALYINPRDIRMITYAPDRIVDALLKGKVDAVCTWSPYTARLRDRLGARALVLSDPGIYRGTWNVVSTQDYVKKKPECVARFLRALLKANRFIEKHPDETQAISAKYIGMESHLYAKEWKNYRFALMLDQTLILNLEDQARWMIKREAGSARKMPNFLDYIYIDGLKSVQPAAVTIPGKQE
ncbi:MAG: NrtA/SsuA/CpmA family ABC transporter substrate-binding protein [Syntrophales bacterium]|nr:NrtA/SsuA/CpmA family ABC transporter substrate-binding protein [Syntrophales bacterium]